MAINENWSKDENGNPKLISREEVPDEIKPPNWLGLEQQLRYSSLYAKAFAQASEKGLSLFMVTLINGKNGDAKESALTYAFGVLGVNWTDAEKVELNNILANNNFTVTIK